MYRFTHLLAAVSCLPAVIAVSAHAAEDVTVLPEMVVGSASAAADIDVPAPVESVGPTDMAHINMVNSEDALKYLPNLVVRKRYIGDRNGILATRSNGTLQSARGVVYADGLLLSNFLGSNYNFPPRWSMVAPEEIERVDVIYGPYSALYPGNSLGATVQLTTRAPRQAEASAKALAYSAAYGDYGTHEHYAGNQASATYGNRYGPLALFLAANRLDSHSQPMAYATLAQSATPAAGGDAVVSGAWRDRDPTNAARVVLGPTGIEHAVQEQLKAKLSMDFSANLEGVLTMGWWQGRRELSAASYLRDAAGNPVYSGRVNIDGRRYTLSPATFAPGTGDESHLLMGATLRSKQRSDWHFEAVASGYAILDDVTRSATTAPPAADAGGPGTVSYGDGTGWRTFDARAEHHGTGDAHRITLGLHRDRYTLRNVAYDASDWRAENLIAFNSSFRGKTDTVALYVQDEWQLARQWALVLGLRHETWRAFDGERATAGASVGYAPRREAHLSPKASLSFEPGAGWLVRGALGRAWRFPTVSELFQGRIVGTTLINNDPNLKPENAWSRDLTLEKALERGRLRLSLFQDDVRDTLLTQTDVTVMPNVTSVQNIGRVRVRGVEAVIEARDVGARGLDVSVNGTLADSRILQNERNPASVGKRFVRIPAARATLLVAYRASEALDGSLAVRYSGRQYNTLDNSDVNADVYGGTSRYRVVDLRLNYRPAKDVALAFGIDNATNEHYYVVHPYPGRTVLGEIRWHL